jgi:steroid delta-isomerase-like uncharacterized protein
MTLPNVVIRYLEAYNRRDVAALVACVTDDVIFENVSNAGDSMALKGCDAFLKLAAQSATLFSVRRQIVRMAVVQDERVALEIDWSGTPSKDLPGMPAGKSVSLRGATFITLRGDHISNITDLS